MAKTVDRYTISLDSWKIDMVWTRAECFWYQKHLCENRMVQLKCIKPRSYRNFQRFLSPNSSQNLSSQKLRVEKGERFFYCGASTSILRCMLNKRAELSNITTGGSPSGRESELGGAENGYTTAH
eukprot:2179866-Rhodomonas_salina.1